MLRIIYMKSIDKKKELWHLQNPMLKIDSERTIYSLNWGLI
jgi:hypothetical protein